MHPLLASLIGLAALLGVAGGLVALAHQRDMAQAYERVRSRGQVIASPFGDIEYLEGGQSTGPVVLVVLGSGGGYDQGELLARAAPGKDSELRWIAPSRFGYLRSTFKPGATFDDQAQANDKGSALTAIFQQDIRHWAITRAMRRRLLELMGVSPAISDSLSHEQRGLADEPIDLMNPVSPRAAGTAFDHRAAMPDERIAAIRAPTLVFHARDDGLQRFHNAEFATK